MDADFSHSPDDLPRLLYTCHKNGADVFVWGQGMFLEVK